jgi:hypothetical protein
MVTGLSNERETGIVKGLHDTRYTMQDAEGLHPQPGEDDAQRRSDEDLDGGVADELAQMLLADGMALEELVNDLVQDAGLDAGCPTHPLGIEHDHDGEGGGHSEKGRTQALLNGHTCGQGSSKGRVGAGHPPRTDQIAQIQLPFGDQMEQDLQALGHTPGEEGHRQHFIG